MTTRRWTVAAILLCATCAASGTAAAMEQTELLELKNTIENLLDALVEQGVLSKEKADALKREAAAKAATDAAEAAGQVSKEAPAAENVATTAPAVVRVPYVPEFV